MFERTMLTAAALFLISGTAWAAPVVNAGGKPGVAESWTQNGATVTLQITSIPKGVTLEGVKNGSTISVVPRVKSKSGVIDPADQPSKLNLGAWYAQPGDTVALRLEKKAGKDKVWVAAAFERKK